MELKFTLLVIYGQEQSRKRGEGGGGGGGFEGDPNLSSVCLRVNTNLYANVQLFLCSRPVVYEPIGNIRTHVYTPG